MALKRGHARRYNATQLLSGIIPRNPNAPAQHQAQASSGYSSRQTCCVAPLKVQSFQCFHRSQADSNDNTAKIILQETITSSNFIYRKRVDELRNYLFRIMTNRIKLQKFPDLFNYNKHGHKSHHCPSGKKKIK